MDRVGHSLIAQVQKSRPMFRLRGPLVLLLLGLSVGLSVPAQAQWCNLNFTFDSINRSSLSSNSTTTSRGSVTLALKAPSSSDVVGPLPGCANPDIEDWTPTSWLYVQMSADDETGVANLRYCANLAVVAQTVPESFKLVVTLGTSDDLGENRLSSNNVAWAYKVTFGSSSYFTCALKTK